MFNPFKKLEEEKKYPEKSDSSKSEKNNSEQFGKKDFVENINNADSVENKDVKEKLKGKWEDYFASFNLQMERAFDQFVGSKKFEKLIDKNANTEEIQNSFNKWLDRQYRKLDFLKENEIDKEVVKETRFSLYGFKGAKDLEWHKESVLKERDEKREKEGETPNIDIKEMNRWIYSPKENAKEKEVKEFKEDVSTYINNINFEWSENVIEFMKRWDIEWLQKYIAPEGSEIYKEYADHAKFWWEKNNPLRSGDFNQATFVALKDFAQKKVEGYWTNGRSTSTKEYLDQKENQDKNNFKNFESILWVWLKDVEFKSLNFIKWSKYHLFININEWKLKYKWPVGRENFEIEVLGSDWNTKKVTFYIEKHEATEDSPEKINFGQDAFGGDK